MSGEFDDWCAFMGVSRELMAPLCSTWGVRDASAEQLRALAPRARDAVAAWHRVGERVWRAAHKGGERDVAGALAAAGVCARAAARWMPAKKSMLVPEREQENSLCVAAARGATPVVLCLVPFFKPAELTRALAVAVPHRHVGTTVALAAAGADASARTFGTTALCVAVEAGDVAAVASLAACGGIDTPGRTEQPPLAIAIMNGSTAITRVLVRAGASLRAESDDEGGTPLHLACAWNRVEAIDMLLGEGAALDARDHRGHTPMWRACAHAHCAAAVRLLRNGAVLAARDREAWNRRKYRWHKEPPGVLLAVEREMEELRRLMCAVDRRAGLRGLLQAARTP